MFRFLWYDDDRVRTLEDKIKRGKDHLAKKFGAAPDEVGIRELYGDPPVMHGVRVVEDSYVLLHHLQFYWIKVPPKARRR